LKATGVVKDRPRRKRKVIVYREEEEEEEEEEEMGEEREEEQERFCYCNRTDEQYTHKKGLWIACESAVSGCNGYACLECENLTREGALMADDSYTCTWCREVIAGEGRAARVVVVQKRRRREGGEGGREE